MDQRGQLILFLFGEPVFEGFVQLVPDFTGASIEDMQKCFVFTVDIGHKMFRTLGQIQNGLQTNNLCTGGLNSGILQGEKLQIPELLRCVTFLCMQGRYLLESTCVMINYILSQYGINASRKTKDPCFWKKKPPFDRMEVLD